MKSPRMPGLDAARALATLAMVVGHTADGLLTDAARQLPWIKTYWAFRGLTAPMFLFVAGWAVIASVDRGGKTGLALIRDRIGRVGLLFGLGIALRWPGWNLPGVFSFDREVWRHLIGFDALHAIAGSLLLGVIVLSVTRNPRARTVALVGLALFFVLGSAAVWAWADRQPAPLPVHSMIVSDGESPFSLFPWAGYFFAGAATGQLLSMLTEQTRKALALGVVGAVSVVLCVRLGLSDLAQTSPVLFLYRLGQVWMIAGAATALPVAVAARFSLLGRSSLVVYVAHLPIVYGWSTIPGLASRYGRTFSVGQVLLAASVLLVIGLVIAELIRRVKKSRRPREQSAGPGMTNSLPESN